MTRKQQTKQPTTALFRTAATKYHVQSSSCCLLTSSRLARRCTMHIKQLQHLHDWHVHEAYINHAVCIRLQKAYALFCFCPADDIVAVAETDLYCNFFQLTGCKLAMSLLKACSCSHALLDGPATVHDGTTMLHLLQKWHACMIPYTCPVPLRLQIARVNIC